MAQEQITVSQISDFTPAVSSLIGGGGGSSLYASTFIGTIAYNSSHYSEIIAHGLGTIPDEYSISFRCTVLDGTYNVGDEIIVSPATYWANSTHIGIDILSPATFGGMQFSNKNSNIPLSPSPGHWEFVFRAAKFVSVASVAGTGWVDVTSSRNKNQVYQNLTGGTLFISARSTTGATAAYCDSSSSVVSTETLTSVVYLEAIDRNVSFPVPNNWYYKLSNSGAITPWVGEWHEMTLGSGVSSSTGNFLRVTTITASGTYTTPLDVGSIYVICIGGGGGGGSYGQMSAGGEGGGHGASASKEIHIPASSYSVIVGSGGAGGNFAGTAGSPGTYSSFGTVVKAPGGRGGINSGFTNPLFPADRNAVGDQIILYDPIPPGYPTPTTTGGGSHGGLPGGGNGGTLSNSGTAGTVNTGGGGGGSGPTGGTGGDGGSGVIYVWEYT